MSAPGDEDDRPLYERFGLRIARRGYDRDQVEAYLTRLLGGAPPDRTVAFELVRRGYERGGVDEVVTRLHREASGRRGQP
ncbi:hypothetical protein [Streptomyces sp. NBC_00338]|uniref:hypothetical protein n=1 Tax=Streptomyces sp. NBC_00338 TaxID=2975715 RepID=UPI002251F7C6|nr:hypothetical protein [Streptomyces sp. NBC_00338]MCX5143849.1 hypothetical protein [Streptomyces sp. NBC_00338]